MRKNFTIILLILFCIYLPVFSAEKWGREGAWGRVDPRWGRGLEAWTLEDLPYIVDWWRIEEGVTTDGAPSDSGDVVWAWYGSINGLSIAQGDNSKRPEYRTDQINGYPAIVFDGSDDWLKGTFGASCGVPYTIISVHKVTSGVVVYSDDNSYAGCVRYTLSKYYMRTGGSWVETDVVPGSVYHILTCKFYGSSSVIRRNGVAGTVGNVGGYPVSGLTLGASNLGTVPTNVNITDIIVCSTGLTTAQMERAERWLNEHRGGIY